MRSLLLLILISLFLSCKDDLTDSNYRNSNYVFYKKDGEAGFWQKIVKNSNYKYEPGTLNYFFDNGKYFSTIKITDSFPNRIVNYYNNNKIYVTDFYKDNIITKSSKIDGFHIEYRSNKGDIIGKGLIKNNVEHGSWKGYDDIGNLKTDFNYKNGLKHGKFKLYFKEGNIKTIGKMWNEMRQDTISWFYNDGKLKCMEITKIDTLNKSSKATSFQYYKNGNLHKKIQIVNEKRNGTCEIFYENGKTEAISHYADDLMHGEGIGYYQSGTISYKGEMIRNNIHGDFTYYKENGDISKIKKFNHGVLLDSIVY